MFLTQTSNIDIQHDFDEHPMGYNLVNQALIIVTNELRSNP